MGAQQSKSSPESAAYEKAVLDRVRSLKLEDEYVHVESEKGAPFNGGVSREPDQLAIETTQSWQSKLLADPKNRFVMLCS